MRAFATALLASLLTAATATAALPERHVNGNTAQPAPTAGKGAVVVHSNPSGTLLVDGRDSGLRTPNARIELDPGAHTLQVVYDDSRQPSGEKTVLIAPGATTTHNFVRKEPASKFEQDCKNGSKEDCWKYGTALIQEKRFDEAIKVFEDWGRNNRNDKRAPIAKFLVEQTRKHAADEAAKAAAGGGTGALPNALGQGLATGSGEQPAATGTEGAAGEANQPGGAAAPAAQPAGDTGGATAAGEADGSGAAADGSGAAAEPVHHLGFSALMGFVAALLAGGGLYLWRRKRS